MSVSLSSIDIERLKAMIENERKNYEQAIQQDKSFDEARKIKWRLQILEAELDSRNVKS